MINELVRQAIKARESAYAPYSNFQVGSALLLKDGSYVLGCNVENASYGLTNCAERTALFKLISQGKNKDDVVAMSIVGDTVEPITPCGACRQVMCELLNKDCKIVLANLEGKTLETTVSELMPFAFDSGDL